MNADFYWNFELDDGGRLRLADAEKVLHAQFEAELSALTEGDPWKTDLIMKVRGLLYKYHGAPLNRELGALQEQLAAARRRIRELELERQRRMPIDHVRFDAV